MDSLQRHRAPSEDLPHSQLADGLGAQIEPHKQTHDALTPFAKTDAPAEAAAPSWMAVPQAHDALARLGSEQICSTIQAAFSPRILRLGPVARHLKCADRGRGIALARVDRPRAPRQALHDRREAQTV